MTTPQQIKAHSDGLRGDLAAIEAELTAARARFSALMEKPGFEPKQAEAMAASVAVLEARRGAIQATLDKNEKHAEHIEELMKSKEYQTGVKRMAELERFFLEEADDVHAEFILLRERLQEAQDKHAEFCDLVNRYCLDLDTTAQTAKIRNKDFTYLAGVKRWLDTQFKHEQTMKDFDAIWNATIEARDKPKQERKQPKREEIYNPPALALKDVR